MNMNMNMNNSNSNSNNKRQRIEDDKDNTNNHTDDSDDDNEEVVVTKVVVAPRHNTQRQERLQRVYLVFTCDCPIEKKRWATSDYETLDTQLLGVFACLKDANRQARLEAYEEEEDDDDDAEDEDTDDDDEEEELFYWQEEDFDGWKARRVWVEEQKIEY